MHVQVIYEVYVIYNTVKTERRNLGQAYGWCMYVGLKIRRSCFDYKLAHKIISKIMNMCKYFLTVTRKDLQFQNNKTDNKIEVLSKTEFLTKEDAQHEMMLQYHFNAIEGNYSDENSADFIYSATFDDNSAYILYKDNAVHYEITAA